MQSLAALRPLVRPSLLRPATLGILRSAAPAFTRGLNYKAVSEGEPDVRHFKQHGGDVNATGSSTPSDTTEREHSLPHPVWTDAATVAVQVEHVAPKCLKDRLAYGCVQALRRTFDLLSGYGRPGFAEAGWVNRVAFLETVAGVPGMVGAMVRHLNSLRRMERDYGWIHTLLEEAENERMHLMTALVVREPSAVFRGCVLVAQGAFLSWYSLSYLISPTFCHRFVGYLEEEAVKTYTHLLKEIDAGKLPAFSRSGSAPPVARMYWQLNEHASLRDVFAAIRADEAHHREVNHTFADIGPEQPNPFPPGY